MTFFLAEMYQVQIIKGVSKTKTVWLDRNVQSPFRGKLSAVVPADRTAHSITLTKKSTLKYWLCKECSSYNTTVANDNFLNENNNKNNNFISPLQSTTAENEIENEIEKGVLAS